jgi:hypothetical protein
MLFAGHLMSSGVPFRSIYLRNWNNCFISFCQTKYQSNTHSLICKPFHLINMKEDVLKFRKVCDLLIREGGYNKNKISIESKLTWPTLKKVLESPIEEIHITASVLGFVQDFTKKHLDALTYEGINSHKTDPEPEKREIVEQVKQKPAKEKTEGEERTLNHFSERRKKLLEKRRPSKEPKPPAEKELTSLEPVLFNPFDLLMQALKTIPSNVTIKITINETHQV